PGQEDTDNDGVGDACVICSVLGETANWGFVARDKVIVKAGTSIYGYMRWGAYLNGPVCTTQAKLANTAVYNFTDDTDPILVATKTTGTAVLFKRPWGGDPPGQPTIRPASTRLTRGPLPTATYTHEPA